MRIRPPFIAVLVIVCLLPVVRPDLHAALPEAARVAFDEGAAAAAAGRWSQAVESYELAWRAAPSEPAAVFNLAVAESHIPGRELRAAAWYEIFLLVAPGAPNRESVRKEIARLQASADQQAQSVLDLVCDEAIAIPFGPDNQKNLSLCDHLCALGLQQLAHANPDAALKVGARFIALQDAGKPFDVAANQAMRLVCEMARLGYFAPGLSLAEQIQPKASWSPRDQAYNAIAEAQIRRNLIADAKATIRLISAGSIWQPALQLDLAQQAAAVGDHAGAEQALADAHATLSKLDPADYSRNETLARMIIWELGNGHWPQALADLPGLRNANGNTFHDDVFAEVAQRLATIFQLRLEANDRAGALEIAEGQPSLPWKAEECAFLSERFPELRSDGTAQKFRNELADSAQSAAFNRDAFVVLASVERIDLALGHDADAAAARLGALIQIPAAIAEQDRPVFEPVDAKRLADTFLSIVHRAAESRDVDALRFALSLDAAKIDKVPDATRAAWIQAGIDAGVELANRTLDAGDVEALRKFGTAHPGAQLPYAFHHLISELFFRGRSAESDALLGLIAYPAIRDDWKQSRLADALSERIETLAPPEASAALESVKSQLTQDQLDYAHHLLAKAWAREGKFDEAGKEIDLIKDDGTASSAQIDVAGQQAEAGDPEALRQHWSDEFANLASEKDAGSESEWTDDLLGRATTTAQTRQLVPIWAPLHVAHYSSATRLRNLMAVVPRAHAAGLYGLEREYRAMSVDASRVSKETSDEPYVGSVGPFELSAADFLDLNGGNLGEFYRGEAAVKLAAAGDVRRVRALLDHAEPIYRRVHTITQPLSYWDLTACKAYDDAWIELVRRLPPENRENAWNALLAHHAFLPPQLGKISLEAVEPLLAKGRLYDARDFIARAISLDVWQGTELVLKAANAGLVDFADAQDSQRLEGIANIRHEVVLIRLRHGDLAWAREEFWRNHVVADNDCTAMIRAAAEGGLLDQAKRWLAWEGSPDSAGAAAIAAGYVAANDLPQADQWIAKLGRNDLQSAARLAVAKTWLARGDMAKARAALEDLAAKDLRRTDHAGDPDYAASLLVSELVNLGRWRDAVPVVAQMSDARLKSDAEKSLAAAAAEQDGDAALAAMNAIADPLERSASGAAAVTKALAADRPDWALAYVGAMSDDGFRSGALGELLNYGIDHHDIAPVLPVILALPAGESKAWLLCDVLRAAATLGMPFESPAVVAALKESLAAMPANFWRVRLQLDAGRHLADIKDPAAKDLFDQARGSLASLSADDQAQWKLWVAQLKQASKKDAAAASQPAPASTQAGDQAARSALIDRWTQAMNDPNTLGGPLFKGFSDKIVADSNADGNGPRTLLQIRRLRDDLTQWDQGRAVFRALAAEADPSAAAPSTP